MKLALPRGRHREPMPVLLRREELQMSYINEMLNRFDRWMVAVTFAEADESVTAMRFLRGRPKKRKVMRKETDVRTEERNRPVLRV